MTNQEELHAKCKAELAAFVEELRTKPIDEVIDRAKEKVFRDEIVKVLSYDEFLEAADAAALLALDKPLEALYDGYYDGYIHGDENHEDRIRAAISYIAEDAAGSSKQCELINGGVTVGDWALVKPEGAYGCMVGQIIAIEKAGAPEHVSTRNDTDDIHIDFTAIEYTDVEKAILLEAFDGLYPDAEAFEDLPLDDVIMPPDMLLSLSEQSIERINELVGNYKTAYVTACQMLAENKEKRGELNDPPKCGETEQSNGESAFGKAMKRGQAKSDAYKAQKAEEPPKDSNIKKGAI